MSYPSILTAIATAFVLIFLTIGLLLALYIVEQADRKLVSRIGRQYTVYISRFPDPLILQFGYEKSLVKLPEGLRFSFAPWGDNLGSVLTDSSDIVYANRNTANQASQTNSKITLREKALCTYQGFSVCLLPSTEVETNVHEPRDRGEIKQRLSDKLKKGKILVRAGTDQHHTLRALLIDLGFQESSHIEHIEPVQEDEDILERVLSTKRNNGVIGFAGGITERLVAERIGYDVAGEQPDILPQAIESNSLAYLRPDNRDEEEDLRYVLSKVEDLWTEAVKQIMGFESVRDEFRRFLNQELPSQLGRKARRALKESPRGIIVEPEDMSKLLSSWIRFPWNEA